FALACGENVTPAENATETDTRTEIQKKLDQYATVRLTTDVSKLSESQKKMIPVLIEAGKIMNELFWYEAYGSKDSLLNSIEDPDLKRYVEINYGPWDRLDGNASFVEGVGEKPAGANFYPPDITK